MFKTLNQKSIKLLALALLWAFASHVQGETSPVYAEDIKAAMHQHLGQTIGDDGIFRILDEVTNESLELRFVQIHDPVRQMSNGVYFACTDFQVDGIEDKLYDVDFWLRKEAGELVVFQTKIHKEPRRSLIYGWYKHPRYTFVNDEIEYLYSN